MTINALLFAALTSIISRAGVALDVDYEPFCNGRGSINKTAQTDEMAVANLVKNMCTCDSGWSSLLFKNLSVRYCVMWTKSAYAAKFDDIYDCVPSSSINYEPLFPTGDWVCFDKHPKYDLLAPHGPEIMYLFSAPSWCSTRWWVRSQNCHCGSNDNRPRAEICYQDGRSNIYPIFAENAPPTAALPAATQKPGVHNYEPYCNGRGKVNRTAQDTESNVDLVVLNLCTCDAGWSSLLFSNFTVRYCAVWTELTYDATLEATYNCVPVSSVEHEPYFSAGHWLCYEKYPKYTLRQPHGPELLVRYQNPSWCPGRWWTRTQSCNCGDDDSQPLPEICQESDRANIVPTYTVNVVPKAPTTVYEPYCNGRGEFNETAQQDDDINRIVMNLCTCDSGWSSMLFTNYSVSYCVVWTEQILDLEFDSIYDCVPTSTLSYRSFFPAGQWACYDKQPKYTLMDPHGPELLYHLQAPSWCQERWWVRSQSCNCAADADGALPEVCRRDGREVILPVFAVNLPPKSPPVIAGSTTPEPPTELNDFDLYCNGRGHMNTNTLYKESDVKTLIANLCECDEGWTSMLFANMTARYCVVWKEAEYDKSFDEIYNCVPSSTVPRQPLFPAGEWVCLDKYPRYELSEPHGPGIFFQFRAPPWCSTKWWPRSQTCNCGDDEQSRAAEVCREGGQGFVSPVFVEKELPPATIKTTTTSTSTTTRATTSTSTTSTSPSRSTTTTSSTPVTTVAVVLSPETSMTTAVSSGMVTTTAAVLVTDALVSSTSSSAPTSNAWTATATATGQTTTTVSVVTATGPGSVVPTTFSSHVTSGVAMGITTVGSTSSSVKVVEGVSNDSTVRQVATTGGQSPGTTGPSERNDQGSTTFAPDSSDCGEHGAWSSESSRCVCDEGWESGTSDDETSGPCHRLGFAGDGGNSEAAPASGADDTAGGGSWIVIALLAVFVFAVGIVLMVRLCRSRCSKGRNDRLIWLWEMKKSIKKRLPRTRPPRGFSSKTAAVASPEQ